MGSKRRVPKRSPRPPRQRAWREGGPDVPKRSCALRVGRKTSFHDGAGFQQDQGVTSRAALALSAHATEGIGRQHQDGQWIQAPGRLRFFASTQARVAPASSRRDRERMHPHWAAGWACIRSSRTAAKAALALSSALCCGRFALLHFHIRGSANLATRPHFREPHAARHCLDTVRAPRYCHRCESQVHRCAN